MSALLPATLYDVLSPLLAIFIIFIRVTPSLEKVIQHHGEHN